MKQHIVTNSGFEIDMSVDALDDMEVFELIVALDKGDVTVLPDLLTRLFTPEQKAALYEHCRKKSGKVPISAVASEFAEIILGLKDSEKK